TLPMTTSTAPIPATAPAVLAPADHAQIAALMRACGLPAAAVDHEAPARALARGADGSLRGYAACEHLGDVALLRCIAVAPDARGSGVGINLMDAILRQLIAAGVQSVALLAIGGQEFFSRFGFIKVATA